MKTIGEVFDLAGRMVLILSIGAFFSLMLLFMAGEALPITLLFAIIGMIAGCVLMAVGIAL